MGGALASAVSRSVGDGRALGAGTRYLRPRTAAMSPISAAGGRRKLPVKIVVALLLTAM